MKIVRIARSLISTPNRSGIKTVCTSLALLLGGCACIPPENFSGCVDFESVPLGVRYHFQESFTDSGALMTVEAFQWDNDNWTTDNYVEAVDSGSATLGKYIRFNNMNLRIDMGAAATGGLTFFFRETGGNINMTVNGEFRNFRNFVDISGQTIGGTAVVVQNGLGNDAGAVALTGAVVSFSVGGQEFWVDNVCAL